jgi:hypothetical protein
LTAAVGPLAIFADAVEECGFDLLAMWFRRSDQKKRSRKVAVAQMQYVISNPKQYQRTVTFHRQQAVCDVVMHLVYSAARRNGNR